MNDNVIPFRRPLTADRADEVFQVQARRKAKIKRIIEGINSQEVLVRFVKKSDRIEAARAVRDLVIRARKEGIALQKIREKFEKIERYMLPAKATLNTRDQREAVAQKLLQRADRYLAIAKHIAEVCGWDKLEEQARILEGTSLWASPSSSAPEIDEGAYRLAELLNEIADRIVREEYIADIFRRARKIPGRWDIATGMFAFTQSHLPCLLQQRYQNWFEVWEEAPAFPNAPLFRELQRTAKAIARVSNTACAAPSAVDNGPAKFSREIVVTVRLWRELALSIGPTTDPEKIGAMFESRAFVDMVDDQENIIGVDSPWSAWGAIEQGVHAYFPDGEKYSVELKPLGDDQDATLRKLADLCWDHTPLEYDPLDLKSGFAARHHVEHYYFSWTPMNARYVAHWLLRRPAAGELLFKSINVEFTPSFTSGTIAHEVEKAAHSGVLLEALRDSASTIRIALDEHEKRWRRDAETDFLRRINQLREGDEGVGDEQP